MFLQLSENGNNQPPAISATDNPFVFIPDITGQTKGFFVREDKFDDLDNNEWNELMRGVAQYQPEVNAGVSEDYFLSSRASRKARREQKASKRDAKTAIKLAKAENIKSGGRGDMVKNIFSGIANTASSIFGGGQQTPGDTTTTPTDTTTPGGDVEQKTIWQTPTPYIIGGVVLTGIIIAVASSKKRKRKK